MTGDILGILQYRCIFCTGTVSTGMRFRPSWMPRILSTWWLGTSRRTGQHSFGGSHRVLPEWRTQIVCHAAPPGRNNNNELLQFLFYDSGRAVPDERLLCYPTRNVYQVDGNLFRSVTQSVKQMCCLLPE